MRKTMRRPPRKKLQVGTTIQVAAREKALKQALLDALEMCWDGKLPFAPLERALKAQ